jgi:dTDP-4-amino-4,6-dideoxygalactose transaminase
MSDGYNSRLDEVQAALLRLKLKNFNEDFFKRQSIASRYLTEMNHPDIILPKPQKEGKHAFHVFAIRTQKRDELRGYLDTHEISTGVHYGVPLHLMPAFQNLGYCQGDFPEAERAAKEMISIPIFPELSEEEQNRVIQAVNSWGNT